jgi:type IV pilus assembly protein PilC
MATTPLANKKLAPVQEAYFQWEGKDKAGKVQRGEMRTTTEAVVATTLRRQGISVIKIKKRRTSGGKSIKQKDIAVFTRQLSAMMAAGVPLLQAFDIVARGNSNPKMVRLVSQIRGDVETGTSLSNAFRKHPLQFDSLYCNLIEAGELGGILEELLNRLAMYQEKTMAIRSKIKSALMYPTAVVIVAFIVVTGIMTFVIPAFKETFSAFGAELPAPTLAVMAMSEFFVSYWYLIFGTLGGSIYFFYQSWRRSEALQKRVDRMLLKIPVFGSLIEKSAIARWTRTLATLSAAGVPLVEALDSVAGASGNAVFVEATEKIQREVSTGTGLTTSMAGSGVFPPMVLQMAAIGEESGSLEHMLSKAAEFYEDEIDEMVKGLSSLMEPFIIVFLGTLIGGIVVAMYLPIFKMGSVV